MVDPLIIASVVFLGVFVQSTTGFGVALVSMAILPALIGVELATPLVALVALTLELLLLIKYYKNFNLRAIWLLVLASYIAIPIGVWALSRVNPDVLMSILGAVIAGYAIYALTGIRLPRLDHPGWAIGTGFIAGLLGGAYNTSGPPVIIYGNCRGWPPAVFKSNLQGFFLFNDLFVVANHVWRQNLTQPVWEYYFWSLPAILVGLLAGTSLDKYIRPEIFRIIVLVLLIGLGLRLMFF